jgi:hypothetical protein
MVFGGFVMNKNKSKYFLLNKFIVVLIRFLFVIILSCFVSAIPHSQYSSFSSLETRVSLSSDFFSITDTIIYETAYISLGGTSWTPITFQGSSYPSSASWLVGSAAVDISNFTFPNNAESYILVYSCSEENNLWDCHGTTNHASGFWQLYVFNGSIVHSTGLIAYYPLDFDARDAIGSNDGSNNGAVLLSSGCAFNGCYQFSGAQYIALTPFTSLSDFTSSVWVYIGDYSSTNGVLAFGNNNNYGFRFRIQPSGALTVFVGTNGTASDYWMATGGTVPINKWTNILIQGKSGEYLSGYIDGVLAFNSTRGGEITRTRIIDFSGSTFSAIGTGYTANLERFRGKIDEVKLWDRVLTLEEIRQEVNLIQPTTCIPDCSAQTCGTDPICGTVCGVCDTGKICSLGSCTCDTGFGDCNAFSYDGCESYVLSDNTNCGSCGVVCSQGQTCSLGVCVSELVADYYVSVNGSDTNSGTINSPLATLQRAITLSSAGDLIYVRGGVYNPANPYNIVRINGKSGTATAPIRIWAYPGEHPVLDGSNLQGVTHNVAIMMENANYWHIKGLELRNIFQTDNTANQIAKGIMMSSGNYNVFEQINAHNIQGIGIRLSGNVNGNMILDSDGYNNYDPLSTINGGNADGFQIAFASAGGTNSVHGCRAWNNSDDGYDFFYNEGSIIVTHSWAFYNGYANGDGSGFKVGDTAISSNTAYQRVLTNCVSFDNKQHGFNENFANMNIMLLNNIAYSNRYRSFNFQTATNSPKYFFKNNIALNEECEAIYASCLEVNDESDIEHNTWNVGFSVSENDFLSVDRTGVDAPRNNDGSIPQTDFLRLSTTSSLVGAGVDVGIEYTGAAPDLGAFESR